MQLDEAIFTLFNPLSPVYLYLAHFDIFQLRITSKPLQKFIDDELIWFRLLCERGFLLESLDECHLVSYRSIFLSLFSGRHVNMWKYPIRGSRSSLAPLVRFKRLKSDINFGPVKKIFVEIFPYRNFEKEKLSCLVICQDTFTISVELSGSCLKPSILELITM